jgi:Ca-activated chloride channel family protein
MQKGGMIPMKRTKLLLALTAFMSAAVLLVSGCSAQTETCDTTGIAETMSEPYVLDTADDAADAEMVFGAPESDGYEEEFPAADASEEYGAYSESPFFSPLETPLSTFSIDVDTASYSNIRRYITNGSLPPADAVRVEECINYFSYDYDRPIHDPIGINVAISDCPWNPGRYLARVSVAAQQLDLSEAPDANIVFLLDVSGSMNDTDKLPLVKSALKMLAGHLDADDTVSIVVYAGASGLVLNGCRGNDTARIASALDQLSAGGSTAGGEGISLAYNIAEEYFIDGGNNRVILCTDGDFNVGPSSTDDLERLIAQKRDSGVFLSVLGFGEGNIKDNKMEMLADKGNGNYAYIDSLMEAKKVLVSEMSATLYTIAKDVKIQIEFNPNAISEYRLVGYDNRVMNAQDFNDDKKDAGEMGAGHTVTAFYELILVGSDIHSGHIDDLVFQDNDKAVSKVPDDSADKWVYVKVRYKQPDESTSQLIDMYAGQKDYTEEPDADFTFASAVAEFALILKDSEYMGDAEMSRVIARAKDAKGEDSDGYRAQFIQLAELADQLLR